MADSIRGSCLCGAVRFTVKCPLLSMGHCHCSMCRRQHGSAHSTYAQIGETQIQMHDGADAITSFESSPGVTREFCGNCGTKLFFRSSALHGQLFIAAGAFDDDPGLMPSYHIFVASKAPWHEISDTLPQHAAYPAGE